MIPLKTFHLLNVIWEHLNIMKSYIRDLLSLVATQRLFIVVFVVVLVVVVVVVVIVEVIINDCSRSSISRSTYISIIRKKNVSNIIAIVVVCQQK